MNITQALAAVAAELPAIGKSNRSPEGYQYRGIEDIMTAAAHLLAKHQVVIAPHTTIITITPVTGMKEGWQDVQVAVDWVIHGPDGDHITARTVGIGRDKSDKGANKAHTQAKKYLLMDLLNVADAADDVEAHDTTPPVRPAVNVSAEMEAIRALDKDTRHRLWVELAVPDSDRPWQAVADHMAGNETVLAKARDLLRRFAAEKATLETAAAMTGIAESRAALEGEEQVAAGIAETFGGAPPPFPENTTTSRKRNAR